MKKNNVKSRKRTLRRFMKLYMKYAKGMVFVLICTVITTVCGIVLPLIAKYLTNIVSNRIEDLTMAIILGVGFGYLGLRIIDMISNFLMAYYGHCIGAKMENDMREEMFTHFERLPFEYFDKVRTGQLMSKITNDLFDITEFAHHCPETVVMAAVNIVVAFAVLATLNVYLTLIIFTIIPIMITVSLLFKNRLLSVYRKNRVERGNINAQVEDSLLGIKVVKSYTNEQLEIDKFVKHNEELLKIKKKSYICMSEFLSMTRIFEGIMYSAVIIFGGIFMFKGLIDGSDFVAFLLYVTTLLTAVRKVIDYMEQFQNGITAIERYYETLDVVPSIKGGDKVLERVRGHIEFKDVTFAYNDGADVLKDMNLDIKAGESVAIVGPSGVGKSTLCNLIPRFYDVTSGAIMVDGVNVKDVTLESLRKNIGIMQQEVYLFAGTVYENIAYGKVGATREEVIEASKEAGAHEFILELENGYDTYVGERGARLSGGQKQRISIARVFLKNPPVLILDEATSALDNESEKIVQQSLEKLSKNRTTLTIAHRLTTVRNADRIIVLSGEGIVESGTHEELMRKRGAYYDSYSMYLE